MLGSILIVDDEPFQRKGLENIILAKRPGVKVETARNGQLALELLEDHQPDLVITDIRMPVMDGLELARTIRQRYPEILIILVSAYQEFEYAKQAIRFGVLDYLLKPYKPEDIENLLRQAEKSENRKNGRAEQNEFRLEGLLSRLLAGTLSQEESKALLSQLDLEGPGCIVNCQFCFPPSGENFRSISVRELVADIGEWLKPRLRQFAADSSAYEYGGLNLLLPGLTDLSALKLMRSMQEHIRSGFGLDCNIGISDSRQSLMKNTGEAAEHAGEARSFQFYQAAGCLTLYAEITDALSLPLPPQGEWEQRLSEAVGRYDLEKIHKILGDMKQQLLEKPYRHPGKVRHMVSVTAISIVRRYERQLYAADFNEIQNNAYTEFFNVHSLQMLFNACEKVLCTLAALTGARNKQGHDKMVEQCLRWIAENISREISLMEAADHFHFNGSYFSSLIKQKTGMSYGQYVLSLRMQEACKLLKNTNEKVQDIALKTGYRDPSYFNRVFRRENGVTPDQFRRRASES